MTVRGGTQAGISTRSHTSAVTHTLRLCGSVYPSWWQGHYSLVSPTRAGFELDRVAERPSMAGQRWGERDQDPSLLPWSGSLELFPLPLSPSHSLCLCLHQINGPGPDRGSVSISTACQACPSPRQPLIHHGFDTRTHEYTHTCTDVYLVASPLPLVLWYKARPQVAMLSGYKLLNPALLSHTPLPRWRDLIACLSKLPARFLSWILNDPFWMKWMKHNWLSVSGTSVPKLGLELRLQGEARSDPSQVGPLPERLRHSADPPLTHCLPPPGSICSEKYLTTGQIQLTWHAHTSSRSRRGGGWDDAPSELEMNFSAQWDVLFE